MINKNCETRDHLWVPTTLTRPLTRGIAASGPTLRYRWQPAWTAGAPDPGGPTLVASLDEGTTGTTMTAPRVG